MVDFQCTHLTRLPFGCRSRPWTLALADPFSARSLISQATISNATKHMQDIASELRTALSSLQLSKPRTLGHLLYRLSHAKVSEDIFLTTEDGVVRRRAMEVLDQLPHATCCD